MFYPSYINLQNRKCLVVGGGVVAERKAVSMLVSGGNVTVISPHATELLIYLAESETINWYQRNIIPEDTKGYYLVCAATDDTTTNTTVYTEAYEQNNIRLVNVVDVIPQCTFAAASVISDTELMISISTCGKSPATSRRIREYFEEILNATSLYTVGYDEGKLTPVHNQDLPYPIYLLLNNRKCVVLFDETTDEIDRRVTLLKKCGANVEYIESANVKKKDLEDAFLVIATKESSNKIQFENQDCFIYEIIDNAAISAFYTPKYVEDDNLIITVSSRNSDDSEKAESLITTISGQFGNNGYGDFINFLGKIRPFILNSFDTSRKRADYFENLINFVGIDNDSGYIPKNGKTHTSNSKPCCLRLKDPNCTSECLFNWVCQGMYDKADSLVTNLLDSQKEK